MITVDLVEYYLNLGATLTEKGRKQYEKEKKGEAIEVATPAGPKPLSKQNKTELMATLTEIDPTTTLTEENTNAEIIAEIEALNSLGE